MATFNPIAFVRGAYANAPWVVIAVVLHVVALAVMGVIYLGHEKSEEVQSETAVKVTNTRPVELEEVVEPPEIIDRKTVPQNVEAEVVEYERDVYVPTDEVQERDWTQELGDPNSVDNMPDSAKSSTSVGVGAGGGQRGSGVTGVFHRRGSGTGTGGPKGQAGFATQGTEKAVLEGLRWLLRHQKEDGSWSPQGMRELCKSDGPCIAQGATYSANYDVGLTGLALLAFLGAGYSNESKQLIGDPVMSRGHKVGEEIKKGLLWLKERQLGDGSIEEGRVFMYNQALASMALTENYGLTQNRFWKEPAQKMVDFICGAQRTSPTGQGLWGWRYEPRQELDQHRSDSGYEENLHMSDTSVTTWCVMALKSAQVCGLKVPKENLDGAMAFIESVTDPSGSGKVGYLTLQGAGQEIQGPAYEEFEYHVAAMSALGMLCRTFVRHDPDDPFFDPAAKMIVLDLPATKAKGGDKKKSPIDYYYWYYGSLALNQLDGPESPRRTGRYWPQWERAMQDTLLDLQNDEEKACQRGGWMDLDQWSNAGGPVYTTAINVLTLEVYYRFENAFGTRVEATAKPGKTEPPKKAEEPTAPGGEGASGG